MHTTGQRQQIKRRKTLKRRPGWRRVISLSSIVLPVIVLLFFGWRLLTPAPLSSPTEPAGQNSAGAPGVTPTPSAIALEGRNALLGKPAPDFTLSTLANYNEPRLHLASVRGKPVVLNFWASWCPPCQAETPLLQKAWAQRTGKQADILFIGIQVADPPERGKAFVERFGVTYPVVTVDREHTPMDYQVAGLPETLFLDRQGRIVRSVEGELTEELLQRHLNAIAQT
ncbi:MAG: redoxin domain-containing protein [Ktedonobacteraceae bacterium]|nr:redoxin domain-containing protein [Ktedonobacteraceae bacterium]